jgi:hypothetical protein
MRLVSGNVALTATPWSPSVKSCPEGPTRLDREIRVGVPARRTDGSGRRTAGRWVAQPAVTAVRFKRPSGRRTRLSRARLGKAAGVPRGADDPQGPNRPGAGGFARRPPGRGSWGLSFSSSGHPHRAPTPGSATHQGGAGPAHQHPPYRSPQVTARPHPGRLSAPLVADLAVSRCPSQGRFRSCAGRGRPSRSPVGCRNSFMQLVGGTRGANR